MRISHEAIYQALYVQGRGALKRELTACLRTGRALRVPRARTQGRGKSFVTHEVAELIDADSLRYLLQVPLVGDVGGGNRGSNQCDLSP